jgi:ribosomal protein S18 acetylase RimI-like enzyme
MPALALSDEGIVVVRGGSERIADLQPLWESLHEHHAAVAPHLTDLGPVRSPGDSWEVRRELYAEWLAEPDAFVLVAQDGRRAVGYALVHMRGAEETWATGERIAELETLTVLPRYRSRGLGRTLVNEAYRQLRGIGVQHLSIAVIASNRDALRFYDRLGLHRFLVTYIGNVAGADAR